MQWKFASTIGVMLHRCPSRLKFVMVPTSHAENHFHLETRVDGDLPRVKKTMRFTVPRGLGCAVFVCDARCHEVCLAGGHVRPKTCKSFSSSQLRDLVAGSSLPSRPLPLGRPRAELGRSRAALASSFHVVSHSSRVPREYLCCITSRVDRDSTYGTTSAGDRLTATSIICTTAASGLLWLTVRFSSRTSPAVSG